MSHPHLPEGQPLDFEEAGRLIHGLVHRHSTYPQGAAFDIPITMTDEEWNAVACAIQMVMIADLANGEKMLPPWMLDQVHSAVHKLDEQVRQAVEDGLVNEFMEEVEGELNHD